MTFVRQAIQTVQNGKPDLILLLGDYAAHLPFSVNPKIEDIAFELAGLKAPLGVFNVFGNHDWRGVEHIQNGDQVKTVWHREFENAGIATLENTGVSLSHKGSNIYLAGVASQMALAKKGRRKFEGYDDLTAALSHKMGEEFTILMAHEPDIFSDVPAGIDLTVSGHTHAGQIRFPNWAPYVPSQFGNKFAYGLIENKGQHLVVSGGIGFSGIPLRLGARSEVTFVEIGPAPDCTSPKSMPPLA